MNFKQAPGIYNASTDELIKSWNDLIEEELIDVFVDDNGNKNVSSLFCMSEEAYYLILPDSIDIIDEKGFAYCNALIGISGKNVKIIDMWSFENCKNLKVVDFPKLEYAYSNIFNSCPKMREKYVTKDGLFVVNNCLIDARNYEKNNIIVPNNIISIARTALYSIFEEVVLPIKLDNCDLKFNIDTKKVILPIKFNFIDIDCSFNTKLVYKGSKEQFQKLIDDKKLNKNMAIGIDIEPYTFEELQNLNYSLKEIESIFDRKLTLDELLKLNYSLKEANNYFKGEEYEL